MRSGIAMFYDEHNFPTSLRQFRTDHENMLFKNEKEYMGAGFVLGTRFTIMLPRNIVAFLIAV